MHFVCQRWSIVVKSVKRQGRVWSVLFCDSEILWGGGDEMSCVSVISELAFSVWRSFCLFALIVLAVYSCLLVFVCNDLWGVILDNRCSPCLVCHSHIFKVWISKVSPVFAVILFLSLDRRSPAAMWTVRVARGWVPPPSGHAGRPSLSPAPVIPPHLLRPRVRESPGAFPPTAPGLTWMIIGVTERWIR